MPKLRTLVIHGNIIPDSLELIKSLHFPELSILAFIPSTGIRGTLKGMGFTKTHIKQLCIANFPKLKNLYFYNEVQEKESEELQFQIFTIFRKLENDPLLNVHPE